MNKKKRISKRVCLPVIDCKIIRTKKQLKLTSSRVIEHPMANITLMSKVVMSISWIFLSKGGPTTATTVVPLSESFRELRSRLVALIMLLSLINLDMLIMMMMMMNSCCNRTLWVERRLIINYQKRYFIFIIQANIRLIHFSSTKVILKITRQEKEVILIVESKN